MTSDRWFWIEERSCDEVGTNVEVGQSSKQHEQLHSASVAM